ncbi:MAG: hypothetical protein WAW59_04875 [Patescibacteria group bacterium]
MKKNLIVPVLLLATSPFVVSCTKSPTDMPPPPPVTGATETVTPETPVVPVETVTQSGTTATETVTPMALTRTETVTYASPASPQDPVEFSVTVTDGVITAASATPKSDNDISKMRQAAFAAEVSTKVVGKKAADLDVDVIGGSSLTTAAFETFVHSF